VIKWMMARAAKFSYIRHLNYPLIQVAVAAPLMEEVTAVVAWADIAAVVLLEVEAKVPVVRPGAERYLISVTRCSG
jgi:hypothetical protein